MRDDHIRYEAIRRRAAQTMRRRLWRSLLWHGAAYFAGSVLLFFLTVFGGRYYLDLFAGPFVLSILYVPVLLLHIGVFFGNWFLDMLRENETWREIERHYDRRAAREAVRDDDYELEREQAKVKRDFARLSDDGEIIYGEDDDVYDARDLRR